MSDIFLITVMAYVVVLPLSLVPWGISSLIPLSYHCISLLCYLYFLSCLYGPVWVHSILSLGVALQGAETEGIALVEFWGWNSLITSRVWDTLLLLRSLLCITVRIGILIFFCDSPNPRLIMLDFVVRTYVMMFNGESGCNITIFPVFCVSVLLAALYPLSAPVPFLFFLFSSYALYISMCDSY